MHNYLSLLKNLESYQKKQEAVAMASIVRREAPTSGKPGDKALITQNGEIKGWIGGGCTRGIVIKEALAAIEERSPRLVRIQTALDTPEQSGVKNYKMTCMSGGSLEVYIEPIMPLLELKIFGRSHIAKALCELGALSGFRVTVISDLVEEEMFSTASNRDTLKAFDPALHLNAFVVVCTQGEGDEESLASALQTDPRYLGFVASSRKANAVLMALKRKEVPHAQLARVKTPAGLDINAKTPTEVAISILAEIIQLSRSEEDSTAPSIPSEPKISSDLYINPVCKIPVSKSAAKHVVEHEGEQVYFCCDGCYESFQKEPSAYI
jgi:xanthine dehydrogenase accessory factor